MEIIKTYFVYPERFWNEIIIWALKHIHRAGGVHQDAFYHILEKTNIPAAKKQIEIFERDWKGWKANADD